MHAQRETIIVHTVGKVASSSIYAAAKAFVKNAQVFHTHSLNEKRLESVASKMATHGKTLNGHVKDSCEVIPLLKKKAPLKVISLVRDPIARDISAFFENAEMFGVDKNRLPPIEEMCDRFLKRNLRFSLDEWFENEFCNIFNINLFSHLFPRRIGWYCFESDNIDFLIMKAELHDRTKESVLRAFLNRPDLALSRKNEMSLKFNSEYYGKFKDHIKGKLVNRLACYDSQYVKYFYTNGELEAFRSCWL